MSDKQHVVPRFYLRRFSADGKQLNVYNLKRNKSFPGASLKGQCYGRNVYGEGPALEKLLAQMEGDFARVTGAIVETNALPLNLPDHFHLLHFLASQHVRPMGAIDEMNASLDLQMKYILKKQGMSKYSDEEMDLVRINLTNPGAALISAMPKCARAMLDLGMILVIPPASREFITSDHPFILYNTYCEIPPVTRLGGNGVVCIGAQLFMPLSPRLLLALYDGKIYTTRDQGELHTATERDVDTINFLQAVFAKENLYYLTDGLTPLLDLSRRARPFRGERKVKLQVFTETPETHEENGRHSDLVFWQTTMPNLKLSLDLLRVRKAAALVTNEERHRERPIPPEPEEAEKMWKANRAADRLMGKRFVPVGTKTRALVDG
jgi:hypothetical protein